VAKVAATATPPTVPIEENKKADLFGIIAQKI
jgi:hypothetical protein